MVKKGGDVRPGDSVQFMGRFVPVTEVLLSHDHKWVTLRVNDSSYARVVRADDALTINVPFAVKVGETYRTNTGRIVSIVDYVDGLGFVGTCGKHRIVYNADGLGAEDHIVELYVAPPEYTVATQPEFTISVFAAHGGKTTVRATCNRTGLYAESNEHRSGHQNREAAIRALAEKVSGIPAG